MSTQTVSAFEKLCKVTEEAYLLETLGGLANWDQETQLPREGHAFRAEQVAYVAGKQHQLMTSKRVGDLIAACEAEAGDGDGELAVQAREWRYYYDRATKVPRRLVEVFERTRSLAQSAWAEARSKSEFGVFQPHLEAVLGLRLEMAACYGYEEHLYDALLESYERGARVSELDPLFDALEPELVGLVDQATKPQKGDKGAGLPRGKYREAKQREFNAEVARSLGFDFGAGRIDTAAHPFCTTLGPRDVRLTTRYDERDFTSSLFGVLHEAGHGLYEQGLPVDLERPGLPAARSISLGIHESQSRLWENHVGRGRPFWKRWLPVARGYFPRLEAVKPKQMNRIVNRAERSFIRMEADEVTYDLHILLRYRLEKALVSGDLAVADLPDAWNKGFKGLLGLKVKKDRDGCLQDVHWSFGLVGYFPTYSLGNINAAQLFHYATQDAAVGADVSKGRYESLLAWLRENVHRHGSAYLPGELMERATGERPNPKYLLEHLKSRYLG